MNILPWGGPTIRAATSLKIPVTELFNPLLIPVLAGILFVLFVAFKLGRDEKVRIGNIENINIDTENLGEKKESRNFIVNILTIIVAIVVLVSGKLSPTVVFMIAFCISIVINFPSVKAVSYTHLILKRMSENDVREIIKHPLAMVCSDAMSLSETGILSQGKPHPRAFGSHARVISKYARDLNLFSIEDAIKKMTSMPANRLGLKNRGILAEDYYADITIIDLEEIEDRATYANPKQYSKGIRCV